MDASFEVQGSSNISKDKSRLIISLSYMNDHHPCHRPAMIFATATAHAARAFALANLLIMNLRTVDSLSSYLFLLWHDLYLLSCE